MKYWKSIGEIIKSVPKVEQLENEDFDETFAVAFITKEDAETSLKQSDESFRSGKCVCQYRLQTITCANDKRVRKKCVTREAVTHLSFKRKQDVEKGATKKGRRNTGVHSGNKTIRVNIDRLDILMNLFEELVIDRGRLQSIASELHNPELTETVERMTRVSGDLQNIILNMRMIPVETVFNRFPKMVRQLARDLDKKIDTWKLLVLKQNLIEQLLMKSVIHLST